MRLVLVAILAFIVAAGQVDASCCGCCGCCGCCCPCPCCCSKPIVIKLPPPPTKIVPCCCCFLCCRPCCCCPCCCCPCCGCGGRRKRAAHEQIAAQTKDKKVKKSLRKILNPSTADRHLDGCGIDACGGCLPTACADYPCMPSVGSQIGHMEVPFIPHIVAPAPLTSADCPPCFISASLKKMKRQRRSVVAILREKLAEKRFVIKEKSARSGSFLFDLF